MRVVCRKRDGCSSYEQRGPRGDAMPFYEGRKLLLLLLLVREREREVKRRAQPAGCRVAPLLRLGNVLGIIFPEGRHVEIELRTAFRYPVSRARSAIRDCSFGPPPSPFLRILPPSPLFRPFLRANLPRVRLLFDARMNLGKY